MLNRNIVILGAIALGTLTWSSAKADDDFNCNSATVPEGSVACQADVVRLEDGQSFSCGDPRNHDQVIYCGAVHGYERNWCARIQAPALRAACFRDTE